MHREFRKLLSAAKGVSEFPIALNVDIRGFSKWSGDSAESGLFIKKVYIRLIDEFFGDASFYKATGDGLLVLLPVDEHDPQKAVRSAVNTALEIVAGFPTLTKGDPMINFSTPEAVGVGLARGPASRLVSGRKTLDYSGTTLNLASRLMDLARPSGVVMDGRFGIELLTPTVAKRFDQETVFPKGVAPSSGIQVFFTPEWTEISPSAKKPLDTLEWGFGTLEGTCTELREISGTFKIQLDSVPRDPGELKCFVRHPTPTKGGRKHPERYSSLDLDAKDFRYEMSPDGPAVVVKMPAVVRALDALKGGPKFPAEVRVQFIAE